MRPDNRAFDQLRPIRFVTNYIQYAEGSVLVEFGRTRVLCNATVETSLPPWMRHQNDPRGWVTATYNMLPRSTHSRTSRETHGLGGRTQEIKRLIARSLRACIDLSHLNACQVIVDCDVLQADGGTRTAAITGGCVALGLALPTMIAQGLADPELVLMPVSAVSVGLVKGATCLDLCYEEDSHAEVDLNVVMNAEGHFIEVQGTAEQGGAFSRSQLDGLLDLATAGLAEIRAAQLAALEQALQGAGGGADLARGAL